jgi:hypothetical protein
MLRSEEFDNAAWNTVGGITINANVETAPNGTLTADRLSGVTIASNRRQQSITLSAVQHTQSCYFKKDTSTLFWLALYDGVNAAFRVEISWTGTVPTISVITAGATAQIFNAGNGWYRISVTYTLTTSGSYSFAILPDRNALTQGIFAWGAQLETGSVATSYIPTVAATATRNADEISKTGISSLIGGTEGTLMVEVDYRTSTTTPSLVFGALNGSGGLLGFASTSTNSLRIRVNAENDIIASVDTSLRHKVALAFNASGVVCYVNGSPITLPNGGSEVVSGLDEFILRTSIRYSKLNVYQVYYSQTRLTNDQLIALTTL